MNHLILLYSTLCIISIASADFYCGFNPPLDQTLLVQKLRNKLKNQEKVIQKLSTRADNIRKETLGLGFKSITEQLNDLNNNIMELNKPVCSTVAQQGIRIETNKTMFIENYNKVVVNNNTILELDEKKPIEKVEKLEELDEKKPIEKVKKLEENQTKKSLIEKENKLNLELQNSLNEPGWIVVQKRINGSLYFYRNWTEYQKGFGDPKFEYFLGLEKLYLLTNSKPHELYIQLESFENEQRFAHYNNFRIGSVVEDYELKSLGIYSGTAGDSLQHNLNEKFSTYDHDRDSDAGNCAKHLSGAWWYSRCGFSNLNGKYLIGDLDYDNDGNGIFWDDWLGWDYSLKSVAMLIRPRKSNR